MSDREQGALARTMSDRARPFAPDAQNGQRTPHPTCVDGQTDVPW